MYPILKTKFFLILFLCLGFISLKADDNGDVNLALTEHIKEYEKAETAEQKAEILRKIVTQASYIDFNIAKAYLNRLEELAETSDEAIVYVHLYSTRGILAFYQDKPLDSILDWYSLALQTIRDNKIDDIDKEITLINNRAVAFQQSNMYDMAIKEYMAGLDILNNLPERNLSSEVLFYSNISNLLVTAKKYDDAYDYILKAEERNEMLAEKSGKRTTFFEDIPIIKADVLYNLGQYDEAEEELIKMLAYENKVNSINNSGKILLGKVYSENNKIELARKVLSESLEEALLLDLGIYNPVNANMAIANLELSQENFTSSLKYLDNVFSLFEKDGRPIDDSEIHESMAIALEQSGRFEESLFHTKEFQKLKSKEIEQEGNAKLQGFKQKLTNIEKQYKINELEIKQKLQGSKVRMLVVAFLMSTLSLFFIYFLYQKGRSLNKTLILKNKEITIAKDRALEAAKAKENFLSTMSHEMRTPMNAIIGITNILMDEEKLEGQEKHFEDLKFSGEGLLHIINEVLDFSKIEACKLEIIKKDFNLKQFLNNIINALRHSNDNRNVKIFQDQQLEELNHFVFGDRIRINQILTNLLGNAIKFTNEGTVVLRSRLIENTDKSVVVKFQVEDTGIGIPSDKLESIFESFSQVNNEINRVHQGTGLGLGISKRLVELQGGTLEVKSIENRGSTFSFTLQFDKKGPIKKIQIVKKQSKIYKAGIEGRKILLVEDNKLNQMVALKVLKKFKVEAELAQNGQEAVDMVSQNQYDLILMDIHMPIMDGIEATERIRALDDNTKNCIPIIALSADAYSDKVREATKCGMNDYQAKPFKPEELFQKIQTNLISDQAAQT